MTDDDLRTMSADRVNEMLADMSYDEAQDFLGRLGHLRAADIYERMRDGNLKTSGLPGDVVGRAN